MDQNTIITQVSREEEALNCQPASEKGNVRRLRSIVDRRGTLLSVAAAIAYRNMALSPSIGLNYFPIAFVRIVGHLDLRVTARSA